MSSEPTRASRHPYVGKPDRAFWARGVSAEFDAATLVEASAPLIRRTDRIVSAGSCFASNLVPVLEAAGLTYLRTEAMHPAFAHALQQKPDVGATDKKGPLAFLRKTLTRGNGTPPPKPAATDTDNFGYANFSAAYGNIYTVRQLLQLLRRATGRFQPAEAPWMGEGKVVDPFRPGLRYKARTPREFEALTAQHLARTRDAFAAADVFVLTLGLTEAWMSREDGAVFPACPGTIGGTFDPQRYAFHNFSVAEVTADLDAFVTELREINPACRFILTVSPVPLVATATDDHVLCASTYSKSVLRVAAQEAVARHEHVTYFPAYEIVTGPQAPESYMAADRRNVTPQAVDAVMAVMLGLCETAAPLPKTEAPAPDAAALSAALLEAECEEVASAHAPE